MSIGLAAGRQVKPDIVKRSFSGFTPSRLSFATETGNTDRTLVEANEIWESIKKPFAGFGGLKTIDITQRVKDALKGTFGFNVAGEPAETDWTTIGIIGAVALIIGAASVITVVACKNNKTCRTTFKFAKVALKARQDPQAAIEEGLKEVRKSFGV